MAGKKMTRITGHNGLPAWTKDIAPRQKNGQVIYEDLLRLY